MIVRVSLVTNNALLEREYRTYTYPRYIRVALKFGARVTISIVLCTVPLIVRDVVVNTCVVSVARISPTANEVWVHFTKQDSSLSDMWRFMNEESRKRKSRKNCFERTNVRPRNHDPDVDYISSLLPTSLYLPTTDTSEEAQPTGGRQSSL